MAVGRRSQARLEMLGRRGANRRRARANAPFVALAATLVLGVVVGILHNRSRTHHHSDPVLSSARTALAPVQTATFRAHAAVTGNSLPRGWQWPWAGSALARENARLQAEVARLKVKAEQMRADADEAVRLRAAAGFARKQRKPPLVAPVIGLPPSPLFDTLTLGRGGLREGQVVRTPDGLIGQIREAGPLSSTVLLLCDPGSGVSAYVVRPGEAKPRGVGIVQGQGRSRPLRLDYLRSEDDVRAGDRVVSSGLGGVVPADIRIGTVVSISEDKARALKTAIVRSSAFPHHAREVLVLP
jgi:rod shape-determining protein MreC